MAATESNSQTFKVAFLLCLVCSVLVSAAAVSLRDRQNANKQNDKKKNILIAAGLYDESRGAIVENDDVPSGTTLSDLFEKPQAGSKGHAWIETQIIDLRTGQPIDESARKLIEKRFGSVANYDQRKASRDPSPDWTQPIPAEKDIASIKRREHFAAVYVVHKSDGTLDQIVLPIRGYGLWSTLWGFISLDADLRTIRGLTFYEHAETPGLGGEVDNVNWKSLWKGKYAFGENGKVQIRVIKGQVDPRSDDAKYKVDGLSGATITSNGVSNMMKYWLGPDGFGPYLDWLKKQKK
ncbi:MAG: Na(+)-translocating NADH-quinone reductase subunit C [Planctomycetaceae bacterium]